MKQAPAAALLTAAGGVISGFLPAIFLMRWIRTLPFDRIFTTGSLLMTVAALQFSLGGVGEFDRQTILVPLQQGIQHFLAGSAQAVQKVLLIETHPFFPIPFAGLADYLSGDRTAMSLTLLLMMTPPLFDLISLFARPDPFVGTMEAGAHRRQTVAFFRKGMVYRAAPALFVFGVVVILLHAGNFSLNPLYDPAPTPVRPDEISGELVIPLADKTGELTDKKLRKYVMYHGSRQILFLAVVKPDGTIGVALDECEICRPADWNVDAKGYAQRGEHLVCKYCMTPIATATVNSPGGCNPIPIPFRVGSGNITITAGDLISLFEKVQTLEKQGTHL